MNNHPTETRYTSMPNVLFDYWMATLSAGAFKVLCSICRLTFDIHHGKRRVSTWFIQDLTGFDAPTIEKHLAKLASNGLITTGEFLGPDGRPELTASITLADEQDWNT